MWPRNPPHVVTPPAGRPVTAAEVAAFGEQFTLQGDGDQTTIIESLVDAVTDHAEKAVLWRAISPQQRRVWFDCMPELIELEPFRATDAAGSDSPPVIHTYDEDGTATVVSTDVYYTRPDIGRIIRRRGQAWPRSERTDGAYSVTYWAGWDTAPSAVKQMLIRAVVAQSTERGYFGAPGAAVLIPKSIASIGSGYALRRVVVG